MKKKQGVEPKNVGVVGRHEDGPEHQCNLKSNETDSQPFPIFLGCLENPIHDAKQTNCKPTESNNNG
jgi:hypothetical protein